MWDLTKFHHQAGDPEYARLILRDAAKCAEDCLARGDTAAICDTFIQLLGEPNVIVSCGKALRDTFEPTVAAAYHAAVADAEYSYYDVLTKLESAIACAVEAGERLPRGPVWANFENHLIRMKAHRPSRDADRALILGRNTGFDVLAEIQERALRAAPWGEIEVDGERTHVTHLNSRVLLKSPNRHVRQATAHVIANHSERTAEQAEIIKRARVRFLVEASRIRGYNSFIDHFLDEKQLSLSCIDVLEALCPRIRAVGERYFEWLRRSCGYKTIHEYDLGVLPPCLPAIPTPIATLLPKLKRFAGRLHPDYVEVIERIFGDRTILLDPATAKSPAWYAIPQTAGGESALVHAPYYETPESIAVLSHELGHACHLTTSFRAHGPLAVMHNATSYFEIFSILFEIGVINEFIEASADSVEKTFWLNTAIDQFLHFTRDLHIIGKFDASMYKEPEASVEEHCRRLAEARTRVTPDLLHPSHEGLELEWLQNSHQEEMPFYGLEFTLAFLIAYSIFLNQNSVSYQAFSEICAYVPLADACRSYLGIDIESKASFQPVFDHIESQLLVLTTTYADAHSPDHSQESSAGGR